MKYLLFSFQKTMTIQKIVSSVQIQSKVLQYYVSAEFADKHNK